MPTGGKADDVDHDARVDRVVALASEMGVIMASSLQQVPIAKKAGGPSAVLLLLQLDHTGPMRPTQVARLLGLTTGGATKLVDRLERLGCVTRRAAEAGDRRAVDVEITVEGRSMAEAARTAVQAEIDSLQQIVVQLHRLLSPTP